MVFRGDPCGIICLLITYSAVFYADYVVVFWISLYAFYDSLWAPVHVILFNILISFLATAHMRAVLSDPGTVPLPQARVDFSDYHQKNKDSNQGQGDESWTVCTRCESYRPPRAHHCRICKRCIRKMDHHCPWINNCVGEFNQKFFIQFLFYVGLLSAYAMVLVGWTWACKSCPKEELQHKQNRILHEVILMLESLLFGLFVLAIMIDQLSAIFSDETAVEQVKNRKNRQAHHPSPAFRRTKMDLMREVFGKRVLFWFIPCADLMVLHSKKLYSEGHLDV